MDNTTGIFIKQKSRNNNIQITYPNAPVSLDDLDTMDDLVIRALTIPIGTPAKEFYSEAEYESIESKIKSWNPQWLRYGKQSLSLKSKNVRDCIVLLDFFNIPIKILRYELRSSSLNTFMISNWSPYAFDKCMRPIQFIQKEPLHIDEKGDNEYIERMWETITKQPPTSKDISGIVNDLQSALYQFHISIIINCLLYARPISHFARKTGLLESVIFNYIGSEFYVDTVLHVIKTRHDTMKVFKQFVHKNRNSEVTIERILSDSLQIPLSQAAKCLNATNYYGNMVE